VASYHAYRKLVPEHRRIDDFPAWLRAKVAHLRRAQPRTSFIGWCGCEALARVIQDKLEDLARHPDRPISPKAIGQLRRALATMQSDLDESCPF
jgi:hypothetical protein